MFVKLQIFLTMLYLSGVCTEYPACRQYDFNDLDSVLSFESCSQGKAFVIKSYADAYFKPFRNDVNYFLSNAKGAATSCFRTNQIFNLNNYTEFFSMIYLNSEVKNDNSHVMLVAIDSSDDNTYLLGDLIGQNEWKEYYTYGNFPSKKVKIEIRAYISADAVLGIEYFHIINPRKAEMYCRRGTTTIKTTATTPSQITAKTELTPTETQSTSIQTQSTPKTIEIQPSPTETTTTQILTQPSHTETETTPTIEQTTNMETMEQTTYTETKPVATEQTTLSQTPCVERAPSKVFNIYNFISFFNFTSKIIN